MGEWNNTAYIRCSDLNFIKQKISQLFAQDGYYQISKPPTLKKAPYNPMQYGNAKANSLWAVAIFPGAPSWTVIKTAPLELLCERTTGFEQPRIAVLASKIGCDAFQLNLYDGDSLILIETNARGQIVVSGFNTYKDNPLEFYEEIIAENHTEECFYLLDAPDRLQTIISQQISVVQKAQEIGVALCSHNFQYWSNLLQINILIPCESLDSYEVHLLYFQNSRTL